MFSLGTKIFGRTHPELHKLNVRLTGKTLASFRVKNYSLGKNCSHLYIVAGQEDYQPQSQFQNGIQDRSIEL